MSSRKHSTEQIIRKLREAEVELAKGRSVQDVCKQLGVTNQTYYRWRKEYGGIRADQALKGLSNVRHTWASAGRPHAS